MPQPTRKYCREQAAECAAKAAATGIPEVREGYLNLEQGWLQLAPKGDASPAPAATAEPRQGVRRDRSPVRSVL